MQKWWKIEVWKGSGRLLGDSWLQECCPALLDTSAAAFPALFGGILALLGAFWTAPGRILDGSWAHLGASGAVSGGVLSLLEASRGALGTILGPSWQENGAKLA